MTAVRGGRGGQRTLFRGSIRLDGGTHSDWRLRHTNALSGSVHATHFGSTSQVQHSSIHSSAVPRTDFTSEGRGLRSCRRLCRWARVVAGILAPRGLRGGGLRELYSTKPYPATARVRLFLFGHRAHGLQASSSRLPDVVAADGDRPLADLKVHLAPWAAAAPSSDSAFALALFLGPA